MDVDVGDGCATVRLSFTPPELYPKSWLWRYISCYVHFITVNIFFLIEHIQKYGSNIFNLPPDPPWLSVKHRLCPFTMTSG